MADGSVCDDGAACNVGETCQSGVCTGNPMDCSGAGDQCNTASCDSLGLEGNCDVITPLADGTTCDDGTPCTAAGCQAGSCVFSFNSAEVPINLDVDAITNAVTRDITFIITTCGVSLDARTLPVATDGLEPATLVLSNVNSDADWIAVVEGHTLRRLAPLSFTSCTAPVDLTSASTSELRSGDFYTAQIAKDNLVDITDFSILAVNFNTPIDPSLGSGADATGDAIQGTADFAAIQINFFAVGAPQDGCLSRKGRIDHVLQDADRIVPERQLTGEVPRSRIAVERLSLEGVERADLTGDGVIDTADIRLFARLHHLPLTPRFERLLDRLESPRKEHVGD